MNVKCEVKVLRNSPDFLHVSFRLCSIVAQRVRCCPHRLYLGLRCVVFLTCLCSNYLFSSSTYLLSVLRAICRRRRRVLHIRFNDLFYSALSRIHRISLCLFLTLRLLFASLLDVPLRCDFNRCFGSLSTFRPLRRLNDYYCIISSVPWESYLTWIHTNDIQPLHFFLSLTVFILLPIFHNFFYMALLSFSPSLITLCGLLTAYVSIVNPLWNGFLRCFAVNSTHSASFSSKFLVYNISL